jgi:hypothetical protein
VACLLSLVEAKTAMAMIARNFELELDDTRGPMQERFTFTMIPKGLRVRLRGRPSLTSRTSSSCAVTFARSSSPVARLTRWSGGSC